MANPFCYFRASSRIIRLAVMPYVRFPLSPRTVEDPLHERGIDVSHETVRRWWNRSGPTLAAETRRNRVKRLRSGPKWRWPLDEVFVRVNGEIRCLWRAGDHEGEVLEACVAETRDRKAALHFVCQALKRHGQPHAVVIDGLRPCRPAMTEIGMADRQTTGRWLNDSAETSRLPLRRRERAMLRLRRMRSLQKLAAGHSSVHNHFDQERHPCSRNDFELTRDAALAEWRHLGAA